LASSFKSKERRSAIPLPAKAGSPWRVYYGPYVWLTYNLPDGYADATGVSQPIYALQMQAEDVLYSVVFYNQDSLTEVQGQILSTFRLLE
jgi:hypothetical protein